MADTVIDEKNQRPGFLLNQRWQRRGRREFQSALLTPLEYKTATERPRPNEGVMGGSGWAPQRGRPERSGRTGCGASPTESPERSRRVKHQPHFAAGVGLGPASLKGRDLGLLVPPLFSYAPPPSTRQGATRAREFVAMMTGSLAAFLG